MPYAKTSQRAEQRALREEMRALGMSRAQVAAEFSCRYRLRPRSAWRHAHGWSLTEAAKQINIYAAQAGLDSGGATVTMTAAHLCEHENWPGEGSKPTGRKPTPYLLSLLAAVYGCPIHDLLDLNDHRHLPPADRLTLDKTTPSHQHDEQDTPPSDQLAQLPAPLPAALHEPSLLSSSAGLGPSGAGGGETWSTTAVLRERDAWLAPQRSAELGHLSEGALIITAAHESSLHAEWAEASNIGEATLEQLDADVRRIARDYVQFPPLPMFGEMLYVRDRVYSLLKGRQKPAATVHLHLLAGILCGLLANASTDLGYRDAAAEQARAAWAYGEVIGHNGLRCWTRGMQALIEYWSERPKQAVRLAQSAGRYADSATASARLYSIEGRMWATLGDSWEANRCLHAAAGARESSREEDLHDEVGGVFGFDEAKSYYYAGATHIHLGQADAALVATGRAVELYASGPAGQRSYGAESLARVDMAVAYLLKRRLDGAAEALEPVLSIPAGLRIAQLGERLAGARSRLGDPAFRDAHEGRDLRERIRAFLAETITRQDPDPGRYPT
ncbi:MAG: hypothetical protein ACRDNF_16185 [Streptosporangiaceae bacterium]